MLSGSHRHRHVYWGFLGGSDWDSPFIQTRITASVRRKDMTIAVLGYSLQQFIHSNGKQ